MQGMHTMTVAQTGPHESAAEKEDSFTWWQNTVMKLFWVSGAMKKKMNILYKLYCLSNFVFHKITDTMIYVAAQNNVNEAL